MTTQSTQPPAMQVALATQTPLATHAPTIDIPEALARLRSGAMVLVTDDESREHEADLIVAAEHATPAALAFMMAYGRGLVCVALTGERLDAVDLPPMVAPEQHSEAHGTAFTVSVDARIGTTTGISAGDRAQTVRVLLDPGSRPADLRRPGHVFPLRANIHGVLGRAGHTEAAVDLARLAGLQPAGVICEVLGDDGLALRGAALRAYARRFGLGIVSIAELVAYRWRHDRVVARGAEALLPTVVATFRAVDYRDMVSNEHHVALVLGDLSNPAPVLVRLHSECLTGDALGSLRCDCGDQLRQAQAAIAREGRGVLLYLRQEGRGIGLPAKLQAYALQDAGLDTVEANEQLGFVPDARHYGIAAQMLRDLGLHRLRVLTNNPAKLDALAGFGFAVVERIPLIAPDRPERRRYLDAKRRKLGHLLPVDDSAYANPSVAPGASQEERIPAHGG
jgi:3,4-dihydroxy 2-butanone 4-phosphate synthase / GTP cyclohydrolase II